jgi:dUTP pyrophosphatase
MDGIYAFPIYAFSMFLCCIFLCVAASLLIANIEDVISFFRKSRETLDRGIVSIQLESPDWSVASTQPDLPIPTRGSTLAAGYDFYCPDTYSFEPGEIKIIDLCVQIKIAKSYWLELRDRSSMAKNRWKVLGGTIDPDYTNTIHLILQNDEKKIRSINKDAKICQGIFHLRVEPILKKVPEIVYHTERGKGGFGSTDDKKSSGCNNNKKFN